MLLFQILKMYLSVLPAHTSVYSGGTRKPGGQKREMDPLELELQIVVRHHVGAEN